MKGGKGVKKVWKRCGKKRESVKRKSLFRDTLEPTQWRWKCSQVRIAGRRQAVVHARVRH